MNNVELVRALSWRENALIEEREKNVSIKPNEQCRELARRLSWRQNALLGGDEKRTFGMASLPVGHNARCCLPTQIPSALCAWCLQNFSWLYGLKQRYGTVSNRNRLSFLAWQFVSISPIPVVIMSVETPSSLKKYNPMSESSFGMKRWQIKEKTLFL